MSTILERRFARILEQTWWLLLVRGLIAIAFGAFTFSHPLISLTTLALLFGIYVLADGIGGVITAIRGRKEHEQWVVLLLWSLAGMAIGIITLVAPGLTALALLFYIAIWAISTGVLEIAAAIRLRKEIDNEWALVAGGLLSVIVGLFLLANPGAGALGFVFLIGAYAFALGVLLVFLAFRVRGAGKRIAARHPLPQSAG